MFQRQFNRFACTKLYLISVSLKYYKKNATYPKKSKNLEMR